MTPQEVAQQLAERVQVVQGKINTLVERYELNQPPGGVSRVARIAKRKEVNIHFRDDIGWCVAELKSAWDEIRKLHGTWAVVQKQLDEATAKNQLVLAPASALKQIEQQIKQQQKGAPTR